MGFWAVSLAPVMLESQWRAPRTRVLAQFPKNLSQKMARWVGVQGQVNSAKSRENTPTCNFTHREDQTQNEKKFFWFELEDLSNSLWVWTTLYLNRLATYRVATLGHKVASNGLRGLRALFEKSMSFSDNLFKFAYSAVRNTRSLAALCCYHLERISCKISASWKLQSVASPPWVSEGFFPGGRNKGIFSKFF